MASRADELREIMKELMEFSADATDPQAMKAIEQVYSRMEETCRYLEKGEDLNGKKCTTRTAGEFLLKTWRMTSDKNINKILVRKMAKHYRKITMVFDKLNTLAEEILSYDYKTLRAAEDLTQQILPFLKEGETAYRLAAEREEDKSKADKMAALANDFHTLSLEIHTGKNSSKSVVSFQEISEKATEIFSKLEEIDWDKFISNPLKNPTFVLKETTNKYQELMDVYIIKKFSTKKASVQAKEKPPSVKMKEDVVHIEFDGSRKKSLHKKAGVVKQGPKVGQGPKISTKKKIKTKDGAAPAINKEKIKERSRERGNLYDNKIAQQDMSGFQPVRKTQDGVVLGAGASQQDSGYSLIQQVLDYTVESQTTMARVSLPPKADALSSPSAAPIPSAVKHEAAQSAVSTAGRSHDPKASVAAPSKNLNGRVTSQSQGSASKAESLVSSVKPSSAQSSPEKPSSSISPPSLEKPKSVHPSSTEVGERGKQPADSPSQFAKGDDFKRESPKETQISQKEERTDSSAKEAEAKESLKDDRNLKIEKQESSAKTEAPESSPSMSVEEKPKTDDASIPEMQDPPKKGCLPYFIGISCLLAAFFYMVILFFRG